MDRISRISAGISIALISCLPALALAAPFGGSITRHIICYNESIYARIDSPRGGAFIWTPTTRLYQFGAPSHVGQWLLGLSGAPYYCLVSISPIVVEPGDSIIMMGSSQ